MSQFNEASPIKSTQKMCPSLPPITEQLSEVAGVMIACLELFDRTARMFSKLTPARQAEYHEGGAAQGNFDAGICPNLSSGMCDYFTDPSQIDMWKLWVCNNRKILTAIFRTWEHFSGDGIFPVLGYSAYHNVTTPYHLWHGEQLELRLDLIRHIIKELKVWRESK